jgi:integrase
VSKLGSPAYQVKNALNTVFTPGRSRHDDKARGLADGRVYSFGTMRKYVEDGTRFARWVRSEYGVRDIRHITPAMARAYIDHLAAKERSGGYLGRVQSAIGKLSVALHGERWDLGAGWHSDRRPERAYTPDQARQIEADIRQNARDKQPADVVKLQRIAGLRCEEAVRLRAQDIDSERCTIRADKGTKGGRPRTVRLDPRHGDYLASLKERAERHGGHVFQARGSLGKRTENAVTRACRRLGLQDCGTHGFRKTFAQGRYREYCAAGMSDQEARQKLAEDLSHGRRDVTYSYVPRGWGQASS